MELRNISKAYKSDYLIHILYISGITIPILLIFIFVFVVPFGKEFKEQKRDSKIVERELRKVERHFNLRKSKLLELEFDNKTLLKQLRTPKDIDIFLEENPFMAKATLLNSSTIEEKYLDRVTYRIETKQLYTTLENFYDVIENNSNFGFRFQVDFPIKFEADRQKIKAFFSLNVYKLKNIKKEIVRPYTDIQ
jgi:hypothetical protein